MLDEELVESDDDDPLVDTDGEPETLSVDAVEAVRTDVPDTEVVMVTENEFLTENV